MTIKAGDRWVSKTSPRCFTVANVTKTQITVDVERRVTSREGEVSVETRNRTVERNDWVYFILGYEKAVKGS